MNILLINGNSWQLPIADKSIHCIATSDPYFGLRDYGLPPLDWPEVSYSPLAGLPEITIPAWRGSYGLEPSIEMYIGHCVLISRELWRVLRDDGIMFRNLGDSYNGSGGAGGDYNEGGLREGQPKYSGRKVSCLKSKDLIGVPFRVAFALQADGWYLRSDVIWNKTNPMPESVTDRPARAHEYIFLFAKSGQYFFDGEAIKEEPERHTKVNWKDTDIKKYGEKCDNRHDKQGTYKDWNKYKVTSHVTARNKRTVWTINTAPYSGAHFATFPPALVEPMIKAGTSEYGCCPKCGAQWKRVTKTVGIKNHGQLRKRADAPGAKVSPSSVFRTGNIEQKTTIGFVPTCFCYGKPSLQQVTCPKCEGTGKELIYKTELTRREEREKTGRTDGKVSGPGGNNYKIETGKLCPDCKGTGYIMGEVWPDEKDTWEVKPCTILDPFAGSGTSLMVARNLKRNAIGIDLSFSYLHEQARARLGLSQLDEWNNGKKEQETPLQGLPMFEVIADGNF